MGELPPCLAAETETLRAAHAAPNRNLKGWWDREFASLGLLWSGARARS